MSDSEYLIDGQVVTYWGGRKDTDTATWRDATDLELKQQAEIDSLTAELEQVKADHAELVRTCEVYVRDSYPPTPKYDLQRFEIMCDALAKLQGSKE